VALPNDIPLIGLEDVKISPLTADASSAPTYGTAIDCKGASSLSMTNVMESKELKGDGTTVATYSRITGADIEAVIGMVPMSALPTIMGGAIAQSGTTPNQKTTYTLASDSPGPAYFKIEGQMDPVEAGIGDVHLVAYKVKCLEPPSFSVNDVSGEYGTLTIRGKAIPCTSNKKCIEVIVNETKAAIS
jgi:hypothetical protein